MSFSFVYSRVFLDEHDRSQNRIIMEYKYITAEQFELINRYLNGEKVSIPYNVLKNFTTMHQQLSIQIIDNCARASAEASRLRGQMGEIQNIQAQKEQQKKAATEITELGMNSLELAQCVQYCLQGKSCNSITNKTTVYKIMYILYKVYSFWLYKHNESVCIEKPVAQSWGPNFWIVKNGIDTRKNIAPDIFNRLMEQNPQLARVVESAVDTYFDYTEHDLRKYLQRSMPYKNALPERNEGKWNGRILDEDILKWETKEQNKRSQEA